MADKLLENSCYVFPWMQKVIKDYVHPVLNVFNFGYRLDSSEHVFPNIEGPSQFFAYCYIGISGNALVYSSADF